MTNATVFPKLTEKEQNTILHIPFASFNDDGLDSCWWSDVYCEESEYGTKACRAILVNLEKKGMIDLSAASSKHREDASTFCLTALAKTFILSTLNCTEHELYKRDSLSKWINAPYYVKPEATEDEGRQIVVDFTGVEAPAEPTVKPEPKADETTLPVSKSQLEIIEELKKNIPTWDEGKLTSCHVTVKEDQICFVTKVTRKDGKTASRETFIGRNGGIRAYGKKEHSKHSKLMRAYDDVVKYGSDLA